MLIVSKGVQGWGFGAKARDPKRGKPATRDCGARGTALMIPKTARDRAQRFENVG